MTQFITENLGLINTKQTKTNKTDINQRISLNYTLLTRDNSKEYSKNMCMSAYFSHNINIRMCPV